MRVLLVDRCDADSIWSVMTPASKALLDNNDVVAWTRLSCPSRELRCRPPQGVEVFDIPVLSDTFPLANQVQLHQFVPKFRTFLKTWQPDIVHTHFAIPGVRARTEAKKHGCKTISTQHELFGSMNGLLRRAIKRSEPHADVVTYVSQTVATSFGRLDAGPKHRVIWNHLDFDEIGEATKSAPPRDTNKVVCVGRMVPVKGQRTLLEAWPRILQKRPDLKLHLIGSGPDETLLQKQAAKLGITDSVVFRGWIAKHDALREMASARLAVQPSDGSQEGFGLSLGEALACETAVAASDIPVFREVIGEQSDAVEFFHPGDADSLATACLRRLETPSVSIIPFLRGRYSPEQNAAAYLEVYRELMA